MTGSTWRLKTTWSALRAAMMLYLGLWTALGVPVSAIPGVWFLWFCGGALGIRSDVRCAGRGQRPRPWPGSLLGVLVYVVAFGLWEQWAWHMLPWPGWDCQPPGVLLLGMMLASWEIASQVAMRATQRRRDAAAGPS